MTSAPAICPHCGFDLEKSVTVERDGFKLLPEGVVYFEGERLALSTVEASLLYTLAKANRPLSALVIGQRISEGECSENITGVYTVRIRTKFKSEGIPCPIKTIYGAGYLWEMPA